MTIPSTPRIGFNPRILFLTVQNHLCNKARLCFMSSARIVKWFSISFNQWVNNEPTLTATGTCATGIAAEGASTGEPLRCTLPSWQSQIACRKCGQIYYITIWLRDFVPTSPYSSGLAPSDYHLFYSLDNHFHGKSFANAADLGQEIGNFFASKIPEFFRWIHFGRSY